MAAKVLTQVTSQTRHWPDFHGAMEHPSGRLPSHLHWPEDSRVDGALTTAGDPHMMTLKAAYHGKQPWFFVQLSPCDLHSGDRWEVVYPDRDQQLSWLCSHLFIGLGKGQGGHASRPQDP